MGKTNELRCLYVIWSGSESELL